MCEGRDVLQEFDFMQFLSCCRNLTSCNFPWAPAVWNYKESLGIHVILPFPTLLTGHPKGQVGTCLHNAKYTPDPVAEKVKDVESCWSKAFTPQLGRWQISKVMWGTKHLPPKFQVQKQNGCCFTTDLQTSGEKKCLLLLRLTGMCRERNLGK